MNTYIALLVIVEVALTDVTWWAWQWSIECSKLVKWQQHQARKAKQFMFYSFWRKEIFFAQFRTDKKQCEFVLVWPRCRSQSSNMHVWQHLISSVKPQTPNNTLQGHKYQLAFVFRDFYWSSNYQFLVLMEVVPELL